MSKVHRGDGAGQFYSLWEDIQKIIEGLWKNKQCHSAVLTESTEAVCLWDTWLAYFVFCFFAGGRGKEGGRGLKLWSRKGTEHKPSYGDLCGPGLPESLSPSGELGILPGTSLIHLLSQILRACACWLVFQSPQNQYDDKLEEWRAELEGEHIWCWCS